MTALASTLAPLAAVYHYGVDLLERVAAIHNAVDQLKGLHGGRVAVAAGIGPGQYVLPPLVARCRRHYPEVRVQLTVVPTPQVFEQTLWGTVDLGIGLWHHSQQPNGEFACFAPQPMDLTTHVDLCILTYT